MGEHTAVIVIHFYICGGNEQSTHKYVSELLGKETIDTNSYGKSTGHSGSYSTNYQNIGRELLTPDEVRMLDNQYALLFIRGEKAIKDFKYDILQHPNIKYTKDGEAEAYLHGTVTRASANISLETRNVERKTEGKNNVSTNYIILSEKEIEIYLLEEKEYEKNKKSE